MRNESTIESAGSDENNFGQDEFQDYDDLSLGYYYFSIIYWFFCKINIKLILMDFKNHLFVPNSYS